VARWSSEPVGAQGRRVGFHHRFRLPARTTVPAACRAGFRRHRLHRAGTSTCIGKPPPRLPSYPALNAFTSGSVTKGYPILSSATARAHERSEAPQLD
jgi:hypothetical protein